MLDENLSSCEVGLYISAILGAAPGKYWRMEMYKGQREWCLVRAAFCKDDALYLDSIAHAEQLACGAFGHGVHVPVPNSTMPRSLLSGRSFFQQLDLVPFLGSSRTMSSDHPFQLQHLQLSGHAIHHSSLHSRWCCQIQVVELCVFYIHLSEPAGGLVEYNETNYGFFFLRLSGGRSIAKPG